jgi:hypothetical protein
MGTLILKSIIPLLMRRDFNGIDAIAHSSIPVFMKKDEGTTTA